MGVCWGVAPGEGVQVGGCGDWRAPVQQVWFNVECPLQECVCVCAHVIGLCPFFQKGSAFFLSYPGIPPSLQTCAGQLYP